MHALLMWTITLCHSPLLPNMQPEDTTLDDDRADHDSDGRSGFNRRGLRDVLMSCGLEKVEDVVCCGM